MTLSCRLFAALLCPFLAGGGTSLAGAQKAPAQKVVFIGDETTYNWGLPANSPSFGGNPKWIDKGVNALETSAQTLARFQADVVSEKPAIVHILTGAGDISLEDDANRVMLIQQFQANLTAMVAEARHANIKVILGTIPSLLIANTMMQPQSWQVFEPALIQNMNGWIESFGAENNIPVVNYHDLLCSCVGSIDPAPAGQYPLMSGNGFTPSPSGFAVISPVLSMVIVTSDLTMISGSVQSANNVRSLLEGSTLGFTAYGSFSDGIPRALLNTNYAGFTGTWASSDPTVLLVGYNGEASALSPGQAIVTFTALNGMVFQPEVVTVTGP